MKPNGAVYWDVGRAVSYVVSNAVGDAVYGAVSGTVCEVVYETVHEAVGHDPTHRAIADFLTNADRGAP